jgi:hypothetical protein
MKPWMKLFRGQNIADATLDRLSVEQLVAIQASLMAELMLANGELHRRLELLLVETYETPGTGEARNVLAKGAARLEDLNKVLRHQLALILGHGTTVIRHRI